MYYFDKKLENMIEIYFNVEISEAKKGLYNHYNIIMFKAFKLCAQ